MRRGRVEPRGPQLARVSSKSNGDVVCGIGAQHFAAAQPLYGASINSELTRKLRDCEITSLRQVFQSLYRGRRREPVCWRRMPLARR
jgi:hypothetical protein